MSDAALRLAMQQVSEQKLSILKQRVMMLRLRREGGQELDDANTLLHSMKDELRVMEERLEELNFNT